MSSGIRFGGILRDTSYLCCKNTGLVLSESLSSLFLRPPVQVDYLRGFRSQEAYDYDEL